MKLLVEKSRFLKSWQLAERSTGQKSTISVLSGVKCVAAEESTTFMATDLKTSISCNAEGVKVLEPGEAVFPVKVVGELFKKAPAKSFEISVEQGKARIEAGKSLYSFTTYPVSDFPSLPVAENANPLFTAENAELMRILEEGTFAGSPGEEFPQYLSAGLLQKEESYM
ncbi:MAG: DNA polymerase III subunit beta, partial [Synergistota bacterium]|nr:DNA polymerase III subunit beta [Synergistota bacterium]